MNQPSSPEDNIHLLLFFCQIRTGHFGQGTFIHQLLPWFAAHPRIRVTVIKTDLAGAMEVTAGMENGMQVINIPAPENNYYLTTEDVLIQRQYARNIVDICLPYIAELPNLVCWMNSMDYLNVAKVLKERFEDIKLIYVHHGWNWKHFRNIADDEFFRKWQARDTTFHPYAFRYSDFQRDMVMLSDKAISVTHHTGRMFADAWEIPASKLTTIYNGIAEPEPLPVERNLLRERYGFNPADKIILFSGRITHEKGLPFLLEAFRLLADERDDVRLVVAGDGEIGRYLPLVTPHWKKVTFTGNVDHMRIRELYTLADVGVQPSLIEQCSFTAIEMCYHRLPMVVSADIGLDEMFEDGVHVLKVSVQYDEANGGVKYLSGREMADRILDLLRDPTKASTIAENSLTRAREWFAVDGMRTQYARVLGELTGVPII